MLETTLKSGDLDERCGVLLKDGTIVEIKNVAEDPTISYEMNPVEVLPYVKADTIASTWHTHPQSDPNLSGDDYLGFLMWPDLGHAIIGIRDGQVVVNRYRVQDGLVISCS